MKTNKLIALIVVCVFTVTNIAGCAATNTNRYERVPADARTKTVTTTEQDCEEVPINCQTRQPHELGKCTALRMPSDPRLDCELQIIKTIMGPELMLKPPPPTKKDHTLAIVLGILGGFAALTLGGVVLHCAVNGTCGDRTTIRLPQ